MCHLDVRPRLVGAQSSDRQKLGASHGLGGLDAAWQTRFLESRKVQCTRTDTRLFLLKPHRLSFSLTQSDKKRVDLQTVHG